MADSLHQLPTGPVSDSDFARLEPLLSAAPAAPASSHTPKPILAYAIAAAVFVLLSLPVWGEFSLTQIGIKLAVFIVALILIKTYLQ